MPTSTALMMAQSSMRVRTLVLHSWTTLRSSLLKSKTWIKYQLLKLWILLTRTDYIWAKAMGYTGQQLEDSAGVSVGESIQMISIHNLVLNIDHPRNLIQADRWVQVPGWPLQTLQAHWRGSRHWPQPPRGPDCHQGDGPGGLTGNIIMNNI